MKKRRKEKRIDFDTLKKQMLLYGKLGKTVNEVITELAKESSKDTKIWQSSQQEQQT